MTTRKNAKPTYRVYAVRGDGETARWTEIGAAWTNQDGKGFSLTLEALPVGGRLVMREIEGGQS